MTLHRLRLLWLTFGLGLSQPAIFAAKTPFEVGTPHEVSAFGVSYEEMDQAEAPSETVLSVMQPCNACTTAHDECPETETDIAENSVEVAVDTVALRQATDSIQAKVGKVKLPKAQFVPDPNRALWLSLVLPGAGQIYNRKYWKLPFIYGGFLGCAYALIWNQQMYRDYSQAYLDIMDDNPATNSFMEMLPPRFDMTGKEEHYKKVFKRKKDFYRRYRDLSAFCFVGVYILSVVDAYVDAQLSVFDITPDLSMSVEPAVIGNPSSFGKQQSASYGIGCSLRF